MHHPCFLHILCYLNFNLNPSKSKKKQASPHMSQAHMWSSFDKSWMSAMVSRCLESQGESVLYFCWFFGFTKKMRGMIFTITWLSTCKEVEVVCQRNARYWRCDGRWRFRTIPKDAKILAVTISEKDNPTCSHLFSSWWFRFNPSEKY